MPWVSMVCPAAVAVSVRRAAANASPASPAGTNTRPGAVHSWPLEPTTEPR